MNRAANARHGRAGAAVVVLVVAAVVTACAGENLFSLAATASEPGPEVEITTPTSGLTKAIGDSLLVEANVNAPEGASSVVYVGTYEVEAGTAYTPETTSLSGLTNVALRNFLLAAPDQTAGTVVVVVTVTDLAGESGADSVTVTITN